MLSIMTCQVFVALTDYDVSPAETGENYILLIF